jgi:hypothetical protein
MPEVRMTKFQKDSETESSEEEEEERRAPVRRSSKCQRYKTFFTSLIQNKRCGGDSSTDLSSTAKLIDSVNSSTANSSTSTIYSVTSLTASFYSTRRQLIGTFNSTVDELTVDELTCRQKVCR